MLFARHPDGVRPQFASDRKVGGLRSKEVVDDGPGCYWPAIVDLRNNVNQDRDKSNLNVGSYLPHKSTSGVLPVPSLPVASPKPIS